MHLCIYQYTKCIVNINKKTYNAPRATKPSTFRGSTVSALLRHWKASE